MASPHLRPAFQAELPLSTAWEEEVCMNEEMGAWHEWRVNRWKSRLMVVWEDEWWCGRMNGGVGG